MKVLATGGSGDLGMLLGMELTSRGVEFVNVDVAPPKREFGTYVPLSIMDRGALEEYLDGVTCVVHIAAWHGIHEFQKSRDVYEFWDLNITGTFEVLESTVRAGVENFIYISSTSVKDWPGIYAHSKLLGENLTDTYVERHGLNALSLRPRAFIPPWNGSVYETFIDWGKWFWGGASHINDVSAATLCAIDSLHKKKHSYDILPIDSDFVYSAEDLRNWDSDGPGSTFRKYFYDYSAIAKEHGFDIAQKPKVLDISKTTTAIGFEPTYSLKTFLEDLHKFEEELPPAPWEK